VWRPRPRPVGHEIIVSGFMFFGTKETSNLFIETVSYSNASCMFS